jgi:hypothetical protein
LCASSNFSHRVIIIKSCRPHHHYHQHRLNHNYYPTKFVFADGTLESRIRRNLDKKIVGHAIINDGLTDDDVAAARAVLMGETQ